MKEKIVHINEAIKKELSMIVAKEVDLPLGIILTITETETLEDLSESRIFISVFPENKIDEVLKILKSEIYNLQHILNKKVRTRWMPKIKFFEDKKLKEAHRIDALLEKIEEKE